MIPDLAGFDAALPANIDAEKTILGAVMLDNAAYFDAAEKLNAADFSLDSHRRVFLRMSELMNSQRSVDIVTLANELGRTKEIESVGGVAYLASLTEGLPRRLVIAEYIRIVREKRMLREVMRFCSEASTRAIDQSEDPDSLIVDLDRQLLEIARGSGGEATLASQSDSAFQELLDLRERKMEPAVSTGLSSLDRIIGGYRRKRLYVVGGRPSMGKTSLMIEAAIQHCIRGIRSRLVSLEMTSEELHHRMWAAVSEISFERLIEPERLSQDEWMRVQQARELVKEWPLEIDDRDGQTIDFALAGCRLSCRRRQTGFVALDYVQNLRFTGPGKLRYQEISDATKHLRQFAKEENIPVLLLSSITEGPDKNPNKRPTLADLRGSGDLAFHADVAALIHRERGEDGASIDVRSEIVVAKQRGGRTGVAYGTYNTSTLLFEEGSRA
jgi:replicative DNA helicase